MNDSMPHDASRRHGKPKRSGNVEANVGASRIARHSHGDTLPAVNEYRRRERGTSVGPGTLLRAYAHCTTTRRRLPSCLWRVPTFSTCTMRTVKRPFGTVTNMWAVMVGQPRISSAVVSHARPAACPRRAAFFTPSACRVALASNIIIINQTRKGKDNDHSN